MVGLGNLAGHAFISYVREDSERADELQRELEDAGIRIWRDTVDLWPGEDWRTNIRRAIADDALVFIACFSQFSTTRGKSYQNDELALAIEQLRARPPEVPWLIPVRFDDCQIPDRDIGAGRTLASLQCSDLFGHRASENTARLVAAIKRIIDRANADVPSSRPSANLPSRSIFPPPRTRQLTNSVVLGPAARKPTAADALQPSNPTGSSRQGVIADDYASVFQFFGAATRSLAPLIRTAQFRSLVDERTKNFVGRDSIFTGVERMLTGEEFASGYIIIRGEPGIGKTALAAALILRGAYVHHFNIAPENIRSPRQFLENICAQLITWYRLDHQTLPPEAGEDSGFLSQLLAEAAESARQHHALPVVVVIDALDEADDAGLAPSANRLYLPRALPPGVFFVITAREEADYRLDVDNEAEIWLRDDDPANLQDVSRYIESFIQASSHVMQQRIDAWGLQNSSFVSTLTELSEGNFMYLVHVLSDIASGRLSRDTVGGVGGLPRGLRGYYKRHWREMKDKEPERFVTLQRPVLCFLAASREPVSVIQLIEWTHLDANDVKSVISQWREFLNEDSQSEPMRFRIYHSSFRDFLDDEVALSAYHRAIAVSALEKIPGFLSDR